MRSARIERKTAETAIAVEVNLDGTGEADIATGIGFFDHMLHQIARHGLVDLTVKAEGDLFVDGHHTVEDVGIALGEAFKKALGDKKGVIRYGFAYVPLDEALSRVVIDLSGRPCSGVLQKQCSERCHFPDSGIESALRGHLRLMAKRQGK